MDQRHPAPRASDRDREDVVERLRDAAADGRLELAEFDERMALAYAARTRAELVPLLADLPDEGTVPHSLAPKAAPEASRIGGALSSTRRRGTWEVPRRLDVDLFMASASLDFTTARTPPHVHIDLGLVLSSVELVVPPTVRVETDAVRSILSSVNDRARGSEQPSATLRLHGHATLSSVTVKTPNALTQWWRTVTEGT